MWTRNPRVAVLAVVVLVPMLSGLAAHRGEASRAPKVIAISSVAGRIVDDSGFRARTSIIDSMIDSAVRAQGFGVLPRDTVDAIQQRLADSLGGVFDPVTGKRDTTRTEAIERAMRQALHGRLGADLWLRPFLMVDVVPFYGGEAKWRGASEKTGAMGGVGGVLLGTKSGKIPALTLAALVDDSSGKTIYTWGGGIQLLMKANGMAKKPTEVPPDQLLVDRVRMQSAVRRALDSLAREIGVERADAVRGDR